MENNNDFIEFSKSIRRVSEPRIHKISGSLKIMTGLKYYRSIRPNIKEYVINQKQYLTIIREVNKKVVSSIIENGEFKLPSGLGLIKIYKRNVSPSIDNDGNLKVTYKVDYLNTLKLWHEDEDAMNDGSLVRYETESIFKISIRPNTRRYKNSMYFSFRPCRSLKQELKNRILLGGYDSAEMKNRYSLYEMD